MGLPGYSRWFCCRGLDGFCPRVLDGSTLEVKKVLPESSRYMILPNIHKMVLPERSRWFYLKGQDGSTCDVRLVLPERSRWFYLKGKDGSIRKVIILPERSR
jgi:hypothetical protein